MSTAAPACVTCATPLPADAVFCHRCGTRTPQAIARDTGEVIRAAKGAEADQAVKLQAALGETYEVRRLLGRGGFAEVFVAYDKRLKREIAVKTLRADVVGSDTMLERFQREAEAVAKLRHPNVVPIFSVGEGNGIAFYTMPLIEGESLATIVEREGRLSVAESARILRDAAHALHAAHRAGLVHRDIKPDNIMLEGPERAVVVMDFGIARTAGDVDKGLTGTGILIGTPQYMSPEQATGDRAIDHRSDQYSLGMVGYRMLTGQLPFQHESVQTILFKTVTEVPPAPHIIATDVPREMSDAIARALAKDPANRFASMADFASALGAVVSAPNETQAMAARRRPKDMPTRVREARERMPARSRAIVIGSAVIALVALALLWASQPRTFRAVVAEHDDAVFAANALVSSMSKPQRRSEYSRLVANDSLMRFMRKSMSFADADARAAAGIPVWEWSVVLPHDENDVWQVWVGPNQHIRAFRQKVPDTAAGAKLSPDSARRIAAATLAARGWNPARLTPLPDSVIPRKARTDHLVRWRTDSLAMIAGNDTARMELRATVAGDRTVAYSERIDVARPSRSASTTAAIGGILAVLLILAIMLSVALAIRLSKTDQMQWGLIIRVMIGICILLAADVIASALRAAGNGNEINVAGSDAASQVFINAVVGLVLLGPLVLCAGVVGESLAQARRPRVIAGLDDLSRGRWLIPESVGPAIVGYAAGAATLLIEAALRWGGIQLGWRTPFASTGAFTWSPLAEVLSNGAGAIFGAAVLLFAVMALGSWRWTAKLALVVPAILVAMVPWMSGEPALASTIGIFVGVVALTLAFWWGGVLAAFVAGLVWTLAEPSMVALPAGGRYTIAALIGLVLIMAPAIVALLARRRFFRSAAT